MTPVDAFGVVVRSIGLLVVATSCWSILLAGLTGQLGPVIAAVPPFFVGLWLLRGGAAVVRFAYPDESRPAAMQSSAGRAAEAEFGG